MRHLRSIVAAAVLVTATGCCFGGETGACVVEAAWGASRCEPFQEEIWCVWDDPDAPALPPIAVCGGTFHGGERCADLGFTWACDGGYYVRPGFPC